MPKKYRRKYKVAKDKKRKQDIKAFIMKAIEQSRRGKPFVGVMETDEEE